MTEINELYKCEVCGNIVEVVHASCGELVCCSQTMRKVKPQKEVAEFSEKHYPVLIKDEDGNYIIRVGEIDHPMEKEHYIMFIEAISKDKKYLKRVYLEPHEHPILDPACTCRHFDARALCNIHGLFESPLIKEDELDNVEE